MAGSDEGFISRWSRRKEQARAPEPEGDAQDAGPAENQAPPAGGPDEAEIVAQLPDIESLDETSDFTVFMKEGVPQALKRQALRKLWRVNPVFSFLDGMNEYDEDFTIATAGAEGVKTVYQVGKGMLGDRDERDPERDPEDAAPQDAAGPSQVDQAADGMEDEDGTELPDPPEILPAPDLADAPAAEPLSGEASEGETDPASRPRRGTALARRWGGSPE